MSRITKQYFERFKGKKVVLEIVDSFEDIRVEFVRHFGDFKVKMSDSSFSADAVVKIKIVEHFGDVKLEKVSHFQDFEICIR